MRDLIKISRAVKKKVKNRRLSIPGYSIWRKSWCNIPYYLISVLRYFVHDLVLLGDLVFRIFFGDVETCTSVQNSNPKVFLIAILFFLYFIYRVSGRKPFIPKNMIVPVITNIEKKMGQWAPKLNYESATEDSNNTFGFEYNNLINFFFGLRCINLEN